MSAEERIAARRERLLEAALQEYGERGFAHTGVKDVCRTAGLTDRYFYESFADGEELLVAVFDRATERLLALVGEAVMAAPARPEAQARAAIEAFVRALAADPAAARVVFVEAAAAGGRAERRMRTTLRRFAALVAATARPYVAERLSDSTLELGALSLVGAIERVMIEWQDGELEVSVDEIIEHLVAMFLAAGSLVGVTAPQVAPQKEGAAGGV